ncbi:unnamed protein product (mitochondrion) [Plasmodiophora brassicae]|uniref:Uncharacterized protein n=1 Tax=Plasmodiophora brassicae TaxID=37360 RepID=A0A0G4ISV5_PLABS|nr:hypothetical protein PBRA_006421 [Plasmodiophora brassicae]SPQ95119.1 unnamed protein product [Plasmodiophora brassicae]
MRDAAEEPPTAASAWDDLLESIGGGADGSVGGCWSERPRLLCFGDVAELPLPLPTTDGHPISPIGDWAEIRLADAVVVDAFRMEHLGLMTIVGPVVDPGASLAYVIAVDLQYPARCRTVLQAAVDGLQRLRLPASVQQAGERQDCDATRGNPVLIVACNAAAFLELFPEYEAEAMAGMIRRQAFRLGAGVVYCKDKGDRETVVYHVGACLGKASDCLRESVRADSFTHPLMVFRPGADSAELIAATLPAELPDAAFDQLFGGDDRDGPDGSAGRPPVVVAMPHDELVERVRQAVTELELSQASSNVRTPARRRRHSSNTLESPAIFSSPGSSAATPHSQSAVKSFFESLLSPKATAGAEEP